ncbi:MarR family transcriptional regulator [Nocardia otitidiscaviarum]|uniref:MarR family transcriptional regulator n=1 Tax=Nocardia otitidiscaviarum TaxID=1823 RepID=UPI001893B994|nr:MarR family transcriptional regulator [Nocardia otitidiscaviarum]MBF6183356.1 MarR family transcriptional regulator [Nocardia otitidiscaviarum]
MSTTTSTDARAAHENALWQALTDHPASTTNELATSASVPKSTARKILAGWLADDLVTRAADDDNRTGFRWRIADTTETVSTAPEPDPQATSVEPVTVAAAEASEAVDPAITADQTEVEPADEPDADKTSAGAEMPPAADNPDDGHAGSDADDATPAAQPADTVAGVCPLCGQPPKPQPQGLQPGALRGQVEDFLREHPGEEFTPGEIAKALGGKSSGAVYNACFALVGKYVAEHTCERPNKFKLHRSQQQEQQTEHEAR